MRGLVIMAVVMAMPTAARAQAGAAATTTEEAAAPGKNYDKAEFRLWLPPVAGPVQGIILLVPGSNGDGRGEVSDTAWQAFATRHKLAMVGCHINDKPHAQNFIEEYVNVSQGSGQAVLDALASLGAKTKHPELATVPLMLWGMSAGGEFNYEFVNWKPERVLAFVVNKGGIYYTALTSKAARDVPGMLFIGGKDLDSRVNTISGLFALNRRSGALWALAEEPGAAHIVGRSKAVAMVLFEDAMALRLDPSNPAVLKPIADKSGFVGSLKTKTYQPIATAGNSTEATVWFPTERVAKAWMAMVTETPFEP